MELIYQLDRSSRKFICPYCNKKRYVRYIDIVKGDYIPVKYGRCDREISCGYHLNPYKDGFHKYQHQQNASFSNPQPKKQFTNTIEPKKQYYIPKTILKSTLKGYENNTFIQNLINNVRYPFEVSVVEQVIAMYYLGTIQKGYRASAVTFPFIDKDGNVCTIQVKQFDKNNNTTSTDFLHSMLEKHYKKTNKPVPGWLKNYQKNEVKVKCLFGEHLLNDYPNNPVALVEAPKTAIYGTLYFGLPKFTNNMIWLAVYNLSSITYEKCKSLTGRNVILFPDLSKDSKAFNLWCKKANELSNEMPGTKFKVSDLLEKYSDYTEKEKGADIADYIIQHDWREYRYEPDKPVIFKEKKEYNSLSSLVVDVWKKGDNKPTKNKHREIWNIEELESFFDQTVIPERSLKINNYSIIHDVSKYIESHLATVKRNNGTPAYKAYWERLLQLRKIIISINKKPPTLSG